MKTRRRLTFLLVALAMLALPWGGAQATNYANSPIIPKFVDPLPAIPLATPTTPPAGVPADADYYDLSAVQTNWSFSSALTALGANTKVRGYRQNGGPAYAYGGPLIVATKGKPVRITLTNAFSADTSMPNVVNGLTTLNPGNLFIPVDTNLMGAGMGPLGMAAGIYPQNRISMHLHGSDAPWISDGTPHQWFTPAGEASSYKQGPIGPTVANVPDMFGGNPGPGKMTFYYPNQLSGRLIWYHDHAFGITRLNIYAGMVAPYLIHDPAEDALIPATIPNGGALAQGTNWGIPLIIQDKTFVPADINSQDPDTTITAANGTTILPIKGWTTVAASWGGSHTGDLWWPHVYEFNQSGAYSAGGAVSGGVNPQGRWDYGPYLWPPAQITALDQGFGNSMGMTQPSTTGDVPSPASVPESFMDTMVVNGKAYPTITVGAKAYRFRILNGCNDRYLNLQIYYSAASGPFPAPSSTGTANLNLKGSPPYASNITDANVLGAAAASEVSMVNADATMYAIPNTPASLPFGNVLQTENNVPNVPLYYTYTAAVNTVNGPIAAGAPTACVPFDGRVGGVPDPRQTGPQMIVIGNDGGLLPAPTVLANNCVDYTYDRKQITFGNVRNYALMGQPNPSVPTQTLNYPHPGYNLHLGPAERADVVIDFSNVKLDADSKARLIIYNDAPAPQPGFDPRYDYYTGDPDYSNNTTANPMALGMGGAPSTQPGYGPNTRTVMQIVVDPTVDTGNTSPTGATLLAGLQNTTTGLPNYFATNQVQPYVPAGTYAPIQLVGGTTFSGIPTYNKTIAEDFDPVWGKMNAMIGTEQASTNSQGQQTFGFHFSDPSTEIINPYAVFTNNPADLVTTLAGTYWNTGYQTQIWKFTHNGVDTHSIHFHLFNVQVVNRVDWAGVVKPPDADEMGWKETVRMNPLEDIILAVSPKDFLPTTLPFVVPNAVRPPDPTMPVGMTNAAFWTSMPAGAVVPNFPFTNPWPATGLATANNMTDMGWEYMEHCHLLGHEENDMMRVMSIQVAPAAPTLLKAKNKQSAVSLSWTNNETYQTSFSFLVQRATNAAFTTGVTNLSLVNYPTVAASDTLPARGTYYYRVRAQNNLGCSAWSNTVSEKW